LDVAATVDYADAYSYIPEHDQIPPYPEPGDLGYSSTDDYCWADPEGEFTDDSESNSIPLHTRYELDSEIDESRFSDTPSASSLFQAPGIKTSEPDFFTQN
jgi:hypothetical protein